MTTVTQHLLDAFDRLSAEEQQAVTCEILRRMRYVDLPPLSDEELALISVPSVFVAPFTPVTGQHQARGYRAH